MDNRYSTPSIPLFLVVSLLMPFGCSDARGDDHVICIGKYRKNCPSPPQLDGFYTCGLTRDEVAAKICTETLPDGTKKQHGFSTIDVNSESGSPCNYDVFRVICSN